MKKIITLVAALFVMGSLSFAQNATTTKTTGPSKMTKSTGTVNSKNAAKATSATTKAPKMRARKTPAATK